MESTTGLLGLGAVLLALASGCGGKSASNPSNGEEPSGGEAGSSQAGGVSAGGATNGGATTGGDAAGGATTGGEETGGVIAGGVSAGGTSTGGHSGGGAATGGILTAGAFTGGSSAGGASTGGNSAGGAPGGSDSGTGGAEPGGAAPEGGTGGSTPVEAFLDLERSRMDFGTIVLGTTATDTFTLTNLGASTSGIPTISVDPSGSSGAVTVTGCDAALSPGESCSLTLSVTPPDLGLFDTFVHITADPGTDPYLSIYVVGRASGFEVSPPAVLELGDVPPDVPIQHSITITASTPISDLEIWLVGDEVTIDASATTCTGTLDPGESCVVTVQFLASELGWKEEMVGIRAGGSSGQMAFVDITANVTSANDLVVDPENPPPFVAYFEETTDPVVFTVTNVGDGPTGTITAAVVGEWGSIYAISDTDCTSLAPLATCSVSVVCSPPMSASADPRDAVLSITDGNTHVAIPVTAHVTFRE